MRRVYGVALEVSDHETFQELEIHVDAVYHEATKAFFQADTGEGTCLGVFREKTLPFDLHTTADAAWTCLAQTFQHEKYTFSYSRDRRKNDELGPVQHDDTVGECFGVEIKESIADFKIKQVFRRYVELDRIVIAWRSYIDPAEFKGQKMQGFRFLEKGSIVIRPLQDAGNDLTLLRTWHVITPETLGDTKETNSQFVKELTGFVLRGSSSASTVQMIENMLIEQSNPSNHTQCGSSKRFSWPKSAELSTLTQRLHAQLTRRDIDRRTKKVRLSANQVLVLLRDLLLVALGLRPSCLVDCCALPKERVELLLSYCLDPNGSSQLSCGFNQVRAVQLDHNVFFINGGAFLREKMVQLATGTSAQTFLDVNASLTLPRLISESSQKGAWRLKSYADWIYSACRDLIASTNTRVLEWERPSGLNATSLAGILLCYPIVYDIFKDSHVPKDEQWSEQDNCLAMCPLWLLQTTVTMYVISFLSIQALSNSTIDWSSEQMEIILQEFSVPQHFQGSQFTIENEAAFHHPVPLGTLLQARCRLNLQRTIELSALNPASVQPHIRLSSRTLHRVAFGFYKAPTELIFSPAFLLTRSLPCSLHIFEQEQKATNLRDIETLSFEDAFSAGLTFEQLESYGGAVDSSQHAVKCEPMHLHALSHLADVYASAEGPQKALIYYSKASELEDGS
ncbi:hypothetical protein PsorP6_015082 [Peronosclerospora sorghi]|uniref:Uncharacterized protein n=1 Tax=Peronosclerospora sorghi TaxID=230839 RepID=A0ACC0VTS6_9STRA|nr:hypothetical protein PsorP6_015082 [Peronosclerospora sorghi]